MTKQIPPEAVSSLVALLNEAMQFGYPLKNNKAYQDLRATLAATHVPLCRPRGGTVETLVAFAEGRLHHLNRGSCPDHIAGHDSRDPDCPVCSALTVSSREALSPVDQLRGDGWAVAVHNDYKLKGVPHTFWLFTKGDRAAKGEGQSDAEALEQVRAAIAAISAPEAVEQEGEEMDLRAAFEVWVRTKPGGTDAALNRRDFPGSDRLGQYVNPQVEFAWQALCAFHLQSTPVEDPSALRACLSACDRVIEQGGIFEGIDFHALKKGIERGLARSAPAEAVAQPLADALMDELATLPDATPFYEDWLRRNAYPGNRQRNLAFNYGFRAAWKFAELRAAKHQHDALAALPSCDRLDAGGEK